MIAQQHDFAKPKELCPTVHGCFRPNTSMPWLEERAFGCVEAIKSLEVERAPAVIVERDVPDGNWKTMHYRLTQMPSPPKLIVTCRVADERLWAEVLNLGGFDVLAQPFCAREVLRSVNSAYSHWDEEWRKADGGIEEAARCTAA